MEFILQGIVLATAFRRNRYANEALYSPVGYWLIVMLCAVALVSIATLMYVLIERPGIDAGKCFASAINQRLGRSGNKAKD